MLLLIRRHLMIKDTHLLKKDQLKKRANTNIFWYLFGVNALC
jgi:hypothetical protein